MPQAQRPDQEPAGTGRMDSARAGMPSPNTAPRPGVTTRPAAAPVAAVRPAATTRPAAARPAANYPAAAARPAANRPAAAVRPVTTTRPAATTRPVGQLGRERAAGQTDTSPDPAGTAPGHPEMDRPEMDRPEPNRTAAALQPGTARLVAAAERSTAAAVVPPRGTAQAAVPKTALPAALTNPDTARRAGGHRRTAVAAGRPAGAGPRLRVVAG